MKTHLKTETAENQTFETQIEQPKFERHRRLWATLKWFKETPKTEEEFYLRYKDLPDEDVTFLQSFYHVSDDWELFRMICKFWDISISS